MDNGRVEATDRPAEMIASNTKYLVWNNKGRGKNFLTYNLAVEFAISIRPRCCGYRRLSQSNVLKLSPG